MDYCIVYMFVLPHPLSMSQVDIKRSSDCSIREQAKRLSIWVALQGPVFEAPSKAASSSNTMYLYI